MKYEKITPALLDEFRQIVDNKDILLGSESFEKYGHDETEDLVFYPEVVVIPSTAHQVSALIKICNRERIPVTPRGAGTGLSGGALPVFGGVLLSMEKFNKIVEIDERNLQATVEPGVITQVFQEAVAEKNLFYPPDPSSRGSCSLGGNLAENAGGPKAVKYGVTRDYVLSLEVVLPTGEIINTGARVLKNSTGYNLTQLMIGSEGTLGIITKIIFRLLPLPRHNILMLVPFFSSEKACEAVSAIFRAGITPSALEFMERDAIDWALKYVEEVNISIKDEIQAHLLVEIDGNDPGQLFKTAEEVAAVLLNFECDEILFAESASQKEDLWKLRRRVAEAVKANSVYKEEDTVVPRAELPKLLKGVKETGRRFGFKSVCYGHAGDGNLHVNIIKGDLSNEEWNNNIKEGIREIFKLTVALGGTLSGEHGIGWVQKEFMDIAIDPKSMALQKSIKKLFDPNEILNPGKVFQN